MHAVILAGGLGTRLRPSVPDLPKPMAPIQGKPFLAHLLDYLAGQGITHVSLSVCYRWRLIQRYFQTSYAGISIDYIVEPELLGTGGAIVHALQQYQAEQSIFIINGDTLAKVNYREMMLASKLDHSLTIALRYMAECSQYGRVTVMNDLISGFQEKGHSGPGYINAGVYLLRPSLFSELNLPKVFSFESDFLQHYYAKVAMNTYIMNDYFIDIGLPERYEDVRREFI